MVDKTLKIGILGCSGLGKSSIATSLSEALNIPYLSSKDITRPILRNFGYKYSENDYVEHFLSRKEIEFELVDKRLEEERILSSGFVTDRTTLECFCYAFLSLQSYSDDEFSLLEMICKSNMENYTHLFRLPINAGWLEENGIRTMNIHLQRQIDILIQGVSKEWGLKVIDIDTEVAKAGKVPEYICDFI